jgi:cyclohexanone monooxygenase
MSDLGRASADTDAVVVGAGFAGIYAIYHLREQGMTVQGIERADDVGGTWYYNNYPGARCDTESHIYQYQFSDELREEWRYSERYPEQEEILEYLQFASEFLDVRKDIEFNTEVESMQFEQSSGTWKVSMHDGSSITSHYVILALGFLSEPYVPDFDDISEFEGEMYHTAKWPQEGVSFYKKDVGLIGTGSSGIQIAPRIAEDAGQMSIYQRTPNYIVPANNHSISDIKWKKWNEKFDKTWEQAKTSDAGFPYENAYRSAEGMTDEEVEHVLEKHWQMGGFKFLTTFEDILSNEVTNEKVCEFIRSKIGERFEDPELIDKLKPEGYPYAAKRPPLNYKNNRYDWDFYDTIKQPHVELVDVNQAPIEGFSNRGVVTTESEYGHDMVVLATGFDAVTGSYNNMQIVGKGGKELEQKWGSRPRTYLGMAIDEFPNMFMISGPQSPSPITNQILCIEDQVEWIYDLIEYADERGSEIVEVKKDSVEYWIEHTSDIANRTLYTDADSWYQGDNVPGKPSVFLPYPGGYPAFSSECEDEVESGYEGFKLQSSSAPIESD